ncbi:hypothetical protein GE115_00100 [Agromyces sp. CFH 90414]|uniref:Uncharacterized protein n=1 Tax=Agromyces agglutinans TaxID=2662258 RepID=A0A6I2F1F0_9MICO|nr:hypothetical protein [Agromyces agglutinans]MRG58282.1 hypothetical protein [Agromyces agglutinans]
MALYVDAFVMHPYIGERITKSHLRVFRVVLEAMGVDGYCDLTRETIAKTAGVSVQTVTRAIQAFEQFGELDVVETIGDRDETKLGQSVNLLFAPRFTGISPGGRAASFTYAGGRLVVTGWADRTRRTGGRRTP